MKRVAFFLSLLSCAPLFGAEGAGTASGLTLLRNSGARASAMGDAFTAMTNDIRAMEFNPASLGTLENGHASLQYQSGFGDDSFSKVAVGTQLRRGVVGLSVGRYDAGKINLFDGTTDPHAVKAQEDWVANVGYGSALGKGTWGTSLRYFSSRLAETYSDSAMAMDLGAQFPVTKKIRMGVSGPLLQSKIQFARKEEDLPRVYRAGFLSEVNLNLATGRHPVMILLDFPYDATADEISIAGGLETAVGPMMLRAGSNGASDLENITFGAGFSFSRFTVDYAFGLIDSSFDSTHNVNFSMRFGETREQKERAESKRDVQVIQDPQAFPLGWRLELPKDLSQK